MYMEPCNLWQVSGREEERCLRIRELELQLRRMEYRARNAEDCCDQLKRDLNQRIIDYSTGTNKVTSNNEDNFTVPEVKCFHPESHVDKKFEARPTRFIHLNRFNLKHYNWKHMNFNFNT